MASASVRTTDIEIIITQKAKKKGEGNEQEN